MRIHRYKILTIGGTQLWSEDVGLDVVREILEPNGIVLRSPPHWITGDQTTPIVLCEVDTTRTELNDFYQWEEIDIQDTGTFCWRTFYTMETEPTPNGQEWLPIPSNQFMGSYSCKEICGLLRSHQSHLNDHGVDPVAEHDHGSPASSYPKEIK